MNPLEVLNELRDRMKIENIISDNTYEFNIENKTYRVRLPSRKELIECEEERAKKLLEMLQKPDVYKSREQWIKIYKDSGIDIKAMEEKVESYTSEVKQLYVSLTEAQDENLKTRLAEEINTICNKQASLIEDMEEKLQFCIEKKLTDYGNDYLMIRVLEELKENDWKAVYTSIDDMKSFSDKLLTALAKNAFDYLVQHTQL